MFRGEALFVTAALAAVAFLAYRVSGSGEDYAAPVDSSDGDAWGDPWGFGDDVFADDPAPIESSALSLPAFLFMIRRAEHSRSDAESGRAYKVFYGGKTFDGIDDHPTRTGERMGVPLDARVCRAAGLRAGCVSTAAGAYQITAPTWDEFRAAGSWGPRLPDFSEASQDEAARRILQRIGALDALNAGDFEGAVMLAGSRWASLPGSTAQQNPKTIEVVAGFYDRGTEIFG